MISIEGDKDVDHGQLHWCHWQSSESLSHSLTLVHLGREPSCLIFFSKSEFIFVPKTAWLTWTASACHHDTAVDISLRKSKLGTKLCRYSSLIKILWYCRALVTIESWRKYGSFYLAPGGNQDELHGSASQKSKLERWKWPITEFCSSLESQQPLRIGGKASHLLVQMAHVSSQ